MTLTHPCARLALTGALLLACVGPSRADKPANDVYARTLRGTALILTPNGSGSAWVVDLEQGLLVTNEHVAAQHDHVFAVFPVNGPDGRPITELAHYVKNA